MKNGVGPGTKIGLEPLFARVTADAVRADAYFHFTELAAFGVAVEETDVSVGRFSA